MNDDKYNVQDLISFGYEQQPVEFENAFKDIIADRISAAIDNKKMELAQTVFSGSSDEAEYEDDVQWQDDDEQEIDLFDQGTEDGETA